MRSGCVAADINAICAAWPCAITEARSEPAASITAATSSIQSSGAAGASSTRSERPTPRMSSQSTREKRFSEASRSLHERLLPQHLEVARPVQGEDDVARAVPDYLVGEVDIAATGVPGGRCRHARVPITPDLSICLRPLGLFRPDPG